MEKLVTETIFSKVIRGEIPCHKVYEDEKVLAFLDIGPLSRGHVLLIPKEPVRELHQLSDASAEAIGRVLPRLCRAVMATTGASAYNVLQNNGVLAHQAVMHVHFHIIPKYSNNDGLVLEWEPKSLEKADADALAASIAKELTV